MVRATAVVVIHHFQRAKILRAEIERFLGIELAAQATFQSQSQSLRTPAFLPLESRDQSAMRKCAAFQSGRAGSMSERGKDKVGEGRTAGAAARQGLSYLSHRRRFPRPTTISVARTKVFQRWAGVSTSIRQVGEPVAVASSGLSLSHSG